MERLSKNQIIWWLLQERNSGFEPLTFCLEGRHSTAELISHKVIINYFGVFVKSPQTDLNRWPSLYKSVALPLSYKGIEKGHECPLIYSSEFYTKEGTEVLENATILFAFVCLFRQQIKPLYPVETLASPCNGDERSRTAVRSIRILILLNINIYSTIYEMVSSIDGMIRYNATLRSQSGCATKLRYTPKRPELDSNQRPTS